jgi:hypothetical protein
MCRKAQCAAAAGERPATRAAQMLCSTHCVPVHQMRASPCSSGMCAWLHAAGSVQRAWHLWSLLCTPCIARCPCYGAHIMDSNCRPTACSMSMAPAGAPQLQCRCVRTYTPANTLCRPLPTCMAWQVPQHVAIAAHQTTLGHCCNHQGAMSYRAPAVLSQQYTPKAQQPLACGCATPVLACALHAHALAAVHRHGRS